VTAIIARTGPRIMALCLAKYSAAGKKCRRPWEATRLGNAALRCQGIGM
jgi:hypothetical protein